MIAFLWRFKEYIAIFLALLSLVGALWLYGEHKDAQGYDRRTAEYEKAKIEAQKEAQKNIQKTKKESQVVYKYIREQNDNCDIYSNVIGRLPEPRSGQ